MDAAATTLYEDVVNITERYFGPAAHRFVARQIRNHLSKEPRSLRKQDLKGLIDWISLAMSMLVEDENLVNKYVADLRRLTNNHNK